MKGIKIPSIGGLNLGCDMSLAFDTWCDEVRLEIDGGKEAVIRARQMALTSSISYQDAIERVHRDLLGISDSIRPLRDFLVAMHRIGMGEI